MNSRLSPYICTYDNCFNSYSSLTHLRRHEEVHEGNFQCTEINCGKKFKTKFTLKNHVDNIHLKKKSKKYECSECGEKFNKHNWLTSHMFKHTGIKPYICSSAGCEKRFLMPSRLKRHMKIHEGYTCTKENCGETFSKWTLYTKHMLVSHPTIHKCSYCEREFSRSNNLKAHMEIHKFDDREVFLCPKQDCSRFYFMKRNLTQHLKSYHETRTFNCLQEHCHKAFKTEAAMMAHYSCQHDPKKCRRKKKKKSKGKPSFAAHVAGLAPKNWLVELATNSKAENPVECMSVAEQIKVESELITDVSDKSGSTSEEVLCSNSVVNISSGDGCVVDNRIQMLLNLISEKEKLDTQSTVTDVTCISLKAKG